MEHPEAGAAAATAGQGTPGSPRGSWCHPTSRHPTALPTVVSWVPSWHVGAGAVIPGAQTHPLQHARACTHCRLLLWARTHRCSTHTPCNTHWCRGSSAPRHPRACPLPFLAAPRQQEDKAEPRGQEEQPHGPDRMEILESCRKRLLPHVSTRPRPHAGVSAGQSQGTGVPGGSEHPAVAASLESPDLIRR